MRLPREKQIPCGDDRKKGNSKTQVSCGDDIQKGNSAGAAEGAVQRFVGSAWAGRCAAAGQRRHIWAGVWTRALPGKVTVKLEAGRTRTEMAEWLLALGRETPRMVIGIDCCFSYPAWFLRELG